MSSVLLGLVRSDLLACQVREPGCVGCSRVGVHTTRVLRQPPLITPGMSTSTPHSHGESLFTNRKSRRWSWQEVACHM